MRRTFFLIFSVFVLAGGAVVADVSAGFAGRPAQMRNDFPRMPAGLPTLGAYASGRILVKLAPDPEISARSLMAELGVTLLDRLRSLDVYVVAVTPGTELSTAARLSAHPLIAYAEPDYVVRAFIVPNDTYYAEYQWNLRHINADEAWNTTTGNSDVVIAVVDTGVDLTHPDLAGKIVAGYDFVNDDDVPSDDEGHGTHVASIAAAVTNNSEGLAGVSWGARIMPVKVLDADGNGFVSDVADGIRWAADQGADIINLSLGTSEASFTLQDAVNYAYNAGALLVAAAGNQYQEGNPTTYPAAYDHVLAVAATDDHDNHASYSNSGSYVDVAAPGGDPAGDYDETP